MKANPKKNLEKKVFFPADKENVFSPIKKQNRTTYADLFMSSQGCLGQAKGN